MTNKADCPYCNNKNIDIEYLSYHLCNECEGYKKTNHYMPSPMVNPYGFGMDFCINAMADCLANGDIVMYDKWLAMGLKYAHAFLKSDNTIWQWRLEVGNRYNAQNNMIIV